MLLVFLLFSILVFDALYSSCYLDIIQSFEFMFSSYTFYSNIQFDNGRQSDVVYSSPPSFTTLSVPHHTPCWRQQRHYSTVARILNKPACKPTPKFIPWESNNFISSVYHSIVHEPFFTIGPQFHSECEQMDPLCVYKYLQDMDFLNRVDQPLKNTIDGNIQKCYVAASSIWWNQLFVSKQSVFLTKTFSPVVIDSGASYCLTHIQSDFISELRPPPISSFRSP